jgi:hypothetical protein
MGEGLGDARGFGLARGRTRPRDQRYAISDNRCVFDEAAVGIVGRAEHAQLEAAFEERELVFAMLFAGELEVDRRVRRRSA